MNPQHPAPALSPHLLLVLLGILMFGCSSGPMPDQAGRQRGPDGTVSYEIQVETSEPGIRIEVDEDYVGTTPLTVTVFGDKDGTFHNFGKFEYVIRALPAKPGQHAQTKVFHTGGFFTQEDRIPKRIFFDMNTVPGLLQLAPAQPTPPADPAR